jgi:rhodanese-related sulfurtransferase
MNTQRDPTIVNLSPEEVAALLRQQAILLIDVREPAEYATQRIPGALLCPLSTLDASLLPPDEPRAIVFQCGSGKRSEIAAQARLDAGATTARHMLGGIGAWVVAGLPTTRIDPATGKPV